MTYHRARPDRAGYFHLSSGQLSEINRAVNAGEPLTTFARKYGISTKKLEQALVTWRFEKLHKILVLPYTPGALSYFPARDRSGMVTF